MKKLLMCLMCLVVVFLLFSFTPVVQHANAVNMNVDLEKLPDHARKAILDLEQQEDKKEPVTADTIARYETMGVALGKSLNALVKELGVTINEFIKTPVGKLSAGVLLWKLVIYDVFILFLKIGALLVATSILVFSFMRFHVPHKRKTKDPESKEITITWEKKYKFQDGDNAGISAGIHVALAVILMVAFFIVI